MEPKVQEFGTLLDEVYAKVLHSVKTKKIDLSDIVVLTTKAMQIVQKYPDLSGPEKKLVVVGVIENLIEETSLLDESVKETALGLCKTVIPVTIDLLVAAYKHVDFDLEKIKEKCGCFGRPK